MNHRISVCEINHSLIIPHLTRENTILRIVKHCFLSRYFEFLQSQMIQMDKKYRNVVSSLLMIIYFFSLLSAIFHYHHLELLSNEKIVINEKLESDHFRVIFDNNYECIVQHNLVNLQTSLLWSCNDPGFIQCEQIFYKNINCDFCNNQITTKDNPLRAPPSVS